MMIRGTGTTPSLAAIRRRTKLCYLLYYNAKSNARKFDPGIVLIVTVRKPDLKLFFASILNTVHAYLPLGVCARVIVVCVCGCVCLLPH